MGGEILGEEHKERTDEPRIPQRRDTLRGAKLSVGLRSTRGGNERQMRNGDKVIMCIERTAERNLNEVASPFC